MSTAQSLTETQIVEVLDLLGGADTVELKLTVPDVHHRSTAQALGLDPLEAEIRQVLFFDTPDLGLNRAGLVVRARRIAGGRGDTVVKLRPVVPGQIPDDLRRSGKVGVEVDAMPGGFVCSASMKGTSTADAVRAVALGHEHPGSLFSKSQKRFFSAYAPDGMRMRDLAVLGPINILKLKFMLEEFPRKMVAELWLYPDGSRILELSTKGTPAEAFQVAAETRALFTRRGIELSGAQQTKTKTALEFFSSELTAQTR